MQFPKMKRIKINLDNTLSFVLSLFVFVLLVDPTNSVFGIKDIVFILLVGLSALHFPRIKIYSLIIILLVYFIIIITFIFGYISVFDIDYKFTISVLKGFSALILLLWIDKYKIVGKMVFPSLIICFVIIFTFIAFLYYPTFFKLLYRYYMNHNATMMISQRSFLGFNIIALFYKSLPILIIPASIYAYSFFREKSMKHFIVMSLFLIALILGGTRACMLAALSIILINLLLWMTRFNLGKLFLIPMLVFTISAFSILVLKLVLEKNEASNKVKFAHLDSYSDLINKHPEILFTGEGAGSLFYSKGIKGMVVQTEWSYFEIIRMFGLVGASVIIVLFIGPLYLIYRKRKALKYWIPVFIGYLLYLFVGGTNPLLLGSTGMIVLLSAYSYSINTYYELKEW